MWSLMQGLGQRGDPLPDIVPLKQVTEVPFVRELIGIPVDVQVTLNNEVVTRGDHTVAKVPTFM